MHLYSLNHQKEQVGDHPHVILAEPRIDHTMGRYAARKVARMMRRNGISVARSTVAVRGVTLGDDSPDIRTSKVAYLVLPLEGDGWWSAICGLTPAHLRGFCRVAHPVLTN